jgi:hypothetical protein
MSAINQMNNVLDQLMSICRCEYCGCVKGVKPNNRLTTYSNNCNYNITPSYINFKNDNDDNDGYNSFSAREMDIYNYCSNLCHELGQSEGDYWAIFVMRGNCNRKTKDFGKTQSPHADRWFYMR